MSNVFNFSSLLDFIGLLLLLLRLLLLLELVSNLAHITLVSLSFFQFIGNLLQSSSAAFKPTNKSNKNIGKVKKEEACSFQNSNPDS